MSGKSVFLAQFVNAFIFIFLSMLFVYGVTYLSMSRVGNILAQAVIVLLILFFIPITNYAFMSLATSKYALSQSLNNADFFYLYKSSNYLPMPLCLFFEENYQSPSIMNFKVIQSIIYIVIIFIVAQVLFERRKMENNQEGFSNLLVHEIVKGLTMIIPLVAIISSSIIAVDKFEFEWYMLVYFVLAVIYFFVFDLLMFKKVKFSYSMTVFGFLAAISIIISIPIAILQDSDVKIKTYSESDIESIGIKVPFTGSIYEIKDRTIIKRFMENHNTSTANGNQNRISYQIKLKNGKVNEGTYYTSKIDTDIEYIFGNKQFEIARFVLDDLAKHSAYWYGTSSSNDSNIASFLPKKTMGSPVSFQEVNSRLRTLSLSELYELANRSYYSYSNSNLSSNLYDSTNSSEENKYNYKYNRYVGYYYDGSEIMQIKIYNK